MSDTEKTFDEQIDALKDELAALATRSEQLGGEFQKLCETHEVPLERASSLDILKAYVEEIVTDEEVRTHLFAMADELDDMAKRGEAISDEIEALEVKKATAEAAAAKVAEVTQLVDTIRPLVHQFKGDAFRLVGEVLELVMIDMPTALEPVLDKFVAVKAKGKKRYFDALCGVGFTPEQAMQLVIKDSTENDVARAVSQAASVRRS